MSVTEIKVPNIGDFSNVEIIDVLVEPGQTIEKEQSLITLETDKAAMDIPSPQAGTIKELKVNKGDKVSEGSVILLLEAVQSQPEENKEEKNATKTQPSETEVATETGRESEEGVASGKVQRVVLPDLGTEDKVQVIELLMKPGDKIEKEKTLLVLESDKASMDVPSPYSGEIQKLLVKVGDFVATGSEVAEILTEEQVKPKEAKTASEQVEQKKTQTSTTSPSEEITTESAPSLTSSKAYAGPAVRRLAYELGVDLAKVKGTGRKNRIICEDVKSYVKTSLQGKNITQGVSIESFPEIDFAQWGEVEIQELNRIKKLTAKNLHRNWVNIPHVTHFEEADITELETFRQDNKNAAKNMGINLTPLAFIMKAAISSLQLYSQFNSSLSADGSRIIKKRYFHVGVAVDTPNGLVVPVVRDVDKKGLFTIAKELGELSAKAREGKLKAQEMQGSCFSISSLGSIGGTHFTPIINAPDVAILGVSKASMKPVYQDNQFIARLMLPLALSYDHRLIDGAEAARFLRHLCTQLEDIRKLLL